MEKIDGYVVVYIRIKFPSPINDYVNAYVYLDGLENMECDFLGNETYREGNVVGVDTAHYYNEGQTLEEKLEDARQQIKDIIREYKEGRWQYIEKD